MAIDATSFLDLGANDLVLNTNNPAAAYAAIVPMLSIVRNHTWTGPGLGTSSATAFTGLAVVANNQLPVPYTPWHGQPVSPTALLISKTWNGDAYLTGQLNIDDFLAADTGYLFGGSGYSNGDFDYSGTVTAADFALISAAYNAQNHPAATTGQPATTIPAPATTSTTATPVPTTILATPTASASSMTLSTVPSAQPSTDGGPAVAQINAPSATDPSATLATSDDPPALPPISPTPSNLQPTSPTTGSRSVEPHPSTAPPANGMPLATFIESSRLSRQPIKPTALLWLIAAPDSDIPEASSFADSPLILQTAHPRTLNAKLRGTDHRRAMP
jgi:hypothetical protein